MVWVVIGEPRGSIVLRRCPGIMSSQSVLACRQFDRPGQTPTAAQGVNFQHLAEWTGRNISPRGASVTSFNPKAQLR